MKKSLVIGLTGATLFLALFAFWILSLNSQLNARLSKDWFAPPVEFYYGGLQLHSDPTKTIEQIRNDLVKRGYREREGGDSLQNKDFYEIQSRQCQEELGLSEVESCLRLRGAEEIYTLVWQDSSLRIHKGIHLEPIHSIHLEPQLIGEFHAGQPLKRLKTSLSQVPLVCLQAVTGIEDNEFLSHRGVSPSGIVRAILRNLLAGRFAQGGSTITQQLVKNYFLSHEKTIQRKVTEQILSILLETKLNKDQILEKYLNVIYMGQQGPYQILGIGAAARHYFSRSVSELNLAECALLAALINNPKRYNPFNQPTEAEKRRNLVLNKMQNLTWINSKEYEQAVHTPLPQHEDLYPEPSAPYFLELAYNELLALQLPEDRGFKVLTTLSPVDQLATEEGIKSQFPAIQKRSGSDVPLQVAAVRVHLPSYEVTSLVGGTHFRTAPFNRAIRAKRQIGSTIKPFIYWQAFRNKTPWDKILDEPFTWKFDGKEWSPKNYDRKHSGEVFLYEALAKSLNIPAAKLAKEQGPLSLRDTLYASGFEKPVESLPSVALGALEMTPLEVAQIYSTIGNMGRYKKLSSVLSVQNLDGETLYSKDFFPGEERLDPHTTATLISVLKLSSKIGTAQGLNSFVSTEHVAGKTGTSNKLKDSWFVGLTPSSLMVVWVGNDNSLPTKLTGASGALPLWGEIQRKIEPNIFDDFPWPEGSTIRRVQGYDFIMNE